MLLRWWEEMTLFNDRGIEFNHPRFQSECFDLLDRFTTVLTSALVVRKGCCGEGLLVITSWLDRVVSHLMAQELVAAIGVTLPQEISYGLHRVSLQDKVGWLHADRASLAGFMAWDSEQSFVFATLCIRAGNTWGLVAFVCLRDFLYYKVILVILIGFLREAKLRSLARWIRGERPSPFILLI